MSSMWTIRVQVDRRPRVVSMMDQVWDPLNNNPPDKPLIHNPANNPVSNNLSDDPLTSNPSEDPSDHPCVDYPGKLLLESKDEMFAKVTTCEAETTK